MHPALDESFSLLLWRQLLATADDILAVRCYYALFRICLLLSTCKTSPSKSNNLPLVYLPHYRFEVRAVLGFALEARPHRIRLLCDFCLSGRDFAHRALFSSASGFLHIPPLDGHACPRLTVPTAKSVVDFHHQVIAHVGRTRERTPSWKEDVLFGQVYKISPAWTG